MKKFSVLIPFSQPSGPRSLFLVDFLIQQDVVNLPFSSSDLFRTLMMAGIYNFNSAKDFLDFFLNNSTGFPQLQ